MELTGESYLYTLAQVGITFSGFSALLLAIQQMRGIGLTGFHKWVAKIYIVSGMVTATHALIPPLLYRLGMDEPMTWRASSLIIAASSFYRLVRFPGQWRAATNRPFDMRVKLHVTFIIAVNSVLILNGAGLLFTVSPGPVLFAVSWGLFAFFIQFAESFRFFFDEEPEMDT